MTGRLQACLIVLLALATTAPLAAQINYNCPQMNATFSNRNGWLTNDKIQGVFGLTHQGATHGLGWRGRTEMRNGILRTRMPQGEILDGTGFRFDLPFPSTSEAELRYKVRFDGEYHWTLGGKLPGLGGGGAYGRPPRGCTTNNDDGFSARLMFRNSTSNAGTDRRTAYMITYVYDHQLPSGDCGRNLEWDANPDQAGIQRVNIQRNTWYEFRQYIKNSNAGRRNGHLKTYYRQCKNNNDCDGPWIRVQYMTKRPWRRRGVTYGIDQILMETYHGGKADLWRPARDNTISFDDFKLYRKRTCPRRRADGTSDQEVITLGDGLVGVTTVDDFGYNEENAPLSMSVFPNPATDRITVGKPTMKDGRMRIIDLTGKVVANWDAQAGQASREVDISSLPVGTYFLRYDAEGETVTRKFIKY